MKKHRISAVIAAGVLTLAFAGTALADGTAVWDGNGVTNGVPNSDACTGGVEPGETLWIFTGAATGDLTIDGSTNGADGSYAGTQQGNGAFHFITPTPDPLDPNVITVSVPFSASGTLTLSHACPATTTTTTTTTDTTETTETTDTETTTETTTTDTTTSETTTSEETTTTNTPEGSVEAETGTPETTPPPTDALGSTSGPSDGTWQLFLLGAAGLLSVVLLLKPAAATRRNKR